MPSAQNNAQPATARTAMRSSLSEATAIRLFNSVVATHQTGGTSLATPISTNTVGAGSRIGIMEDCKSVESIRSANEFGDSCRICRWNRSDMQILPCPCQCKGSVGYIHLQCLKRWILHRRDNRCEICNAIFEMPDEKINLRRMFRAFMCARCCGAIVKHILFSASLIPLAHVVLQQVLICMDNINQSPDDQLTVKEVIVASCALLTSSEKLSNTEFISSIFLRDSIVHFFVLAGALFFHYFEFITTRFILIRNILRQWWMFGNTPEFAMIELESESYELF